MGYSIDVQLVRRITIVDGPSRHRAFPALALLANGDMLVAYREGSDHWRSADGAVRIARSTDGGTRWSEPATVYEEAGVRCGCHHGLAELSNGKLILPFTRLLETTPHRQELWIVTSKDGAEHWSDPVRIAPQPGWTWHNQYGKAVEARPGVVLVGGGGELESQPLGTWDTGCYVSCDYGESWTKRVTLGVGLDDEKDICRLSDGRYLALIRDGSNTRRLWKTFSQDPTSRWSPVESTPIYGHCPALVALPDGLVLVLHRQVHPDQPPGMAMSYSDDLGLTWREGPMLYRGANWDCSYPSAVLLPSGELFCAYYTSFVNGNSTIEGVGFRVRRT